MPTMAARMLQVLLSLLFAVAGRAGVLLTVIHCKSVACYLVLHALRDGWVLRVKHGL